MSLRVLIAGGGLGGLTLAHGLRQAGLDVQVFERQAPRPSSDLTTSYRIHIDPTGSRALHSCLPAELWETFTAQAAAPLRGLTFTTEHLNTLGFIPDADPAADPIGHSHPISRAGLRQLLLRGLEDCVVFDKRLVHYEQGRDGQASAYFADSSSASGDILVGADGSSSAVRKQLLPGARVVDTGVAGIAGKLYLTEHTRARLPADLLSQMTMVLPPKRLAMFMATFHRRDEPHGAAALDLPEHLFWVQLGRADELGLRHGAPPQTSAQLRQQALLHAEPWHPLLRWVVAESDPNSLVGMPLHTSLPVPAWPTTTVTLLGDAIHTMTPLQGLGGNTALRDAAMLRHHLVEADRGRSGLLSAIHAYESAMLEYGFDAVHRSLQVSNAVTSTNVVGRTAFRVVLRAAARLPWLHQRLFERPAVDLPTAPSAESNVRSTARLHS
jgi:2-polyprenyl-6-methoxyphenol hydroxylase-like FAD-dependent oxidoreductase